MLKKSFLFGVHIVWYLPRYDSFSQPGEFLEMQQQVTECTKYHILYVVFSGFYFLQFDQCSHLVVFILFQTVYCELNYIWPHI